MSALIRILLADTVRIVVLGLVAIYAVLVLMALRMEGTKVHPRLDWSDPARSLERLLIWAGVKVVAVAGQALKWCLAALVEASAEFGEWIVGLRGPDAQARFRSRFL